MGKRKGRCTKNNAASKEALEPEHLVKAPHSFVIHRGNCGKDIMELTKDFREIMEPFTASQLKERKNNSIKDFLSISGYLNVSHMIIFTETELGSYMRLSRLPRGPTLTFKLNQYCLARDVRSSLRKQYVIAKAFQHAPLIVLNSFSGEGMHMKLMASMFQNMFPTINITNVQLKNIRRCVLMNYNPSTKLVELRHYVIRATPVGLNRGTKKVVQGKIPNLNRCKDISEFFEKAGLLSESEPDEDPAAQLLLPQSLAGRAAAADTRSALRLTELGPRISFQLIKVEDGLLDGEVLYHELVEKTEEEKALIKKRREEKKRLKESRQSEQAANVRRKEREREQHKQRSLEGIQRKQGGEHQRLMDLAAKESNQGADSDDDAQYYRDEVGAEPDHDLFSKDESRKRKAGDDGATRGFKKMRLDKKLQKKYQGSDKGQPGPAGKRANYQGDREAFKGRGDKGGFKGRGDKGGFKQGGGDKGGFKRGGDKGGFKGRGDKGGFKGRGDKGGFKGRGDKGGFKRGGGDKGKKKVFGTKVNKNRDSKGKGRSKGRK